ncbi:PAS domain-containing protein [Mycolicibacterium sp.]|uniref:PAS domain-containing protein n=1 Tax=Mycolicibacterium sp. TaxID=2320850 RepID=UPI003566FA90
MASRASGEPIRGLILTALAESDRPLSTAELRRRLSIAFDVYVLNETLYRSLAILARRGDVVKIESRGRSALWQLRADAPDAVGDVAVTPPTGAPSRPERGWRTGTDCLKILRTDGVLLHMNQRGCVALGLDHDERDFGMPWLDLLPEQIRSQGLRALRDAVDGSRSSFAGVTMGPDGQPQYWDNVLTPIEGDDGRIREILCTSRDVTDQVRRGEAGAATSSSAQPGPAAAGRSGRQRRGGAVADRLNRLFETIRAPGQGPYTNSEVLRALADRGVYISAPYLSQLRRGNRKRPSEATVNALAEFFGVLPVYFADTYDEEDLQYLVRLDNDLRWLELTHDPEVRRLTTMMLELPARDQDQLWGNLD